MLLIPPTSRK